MVYSVQAVGYSSYLELGGNKGIYGLTQGSLGIMEKKMESTI